MIFIIYYFITRYLDFYWVVYDQIIKFGFLNYLHSVTQVKYVDDIYRTTFFQSLLHPISPISVQVESQHEKQSNLIGIYSIINIY